MATQGNAPAGSLAASLQAIEVGKLLDGGVSGPVVGCEMLLDAGSHALVVSRLVRNPACRFSHERRPIGAAARLTLREALALGGGDACLFVPDAAFVSKLACAACGLVEEPWLLLDPTGERTIACPRCAARREVRGFDLVERITAAGVPAALLDRPLEERGLRPDEVFGVEGDDTAQYLALRPNGAPPRATLVVAGLGNIGSFLAPLVARMPAVERLLLCDPDVYEPHQLAGQDIGPGAVGRNKAEAQAERLRALRPGLCVEAFAAPVERLPLGALVGAITASCLDSRAARLRLAARAWRAGSPFVDAAVGGGPSLLVRTSVHLPEPDAACFECAFDDADYAALEQTFPCAGATAG